MITIGIPRALGYYTYFPFWNTILENLGARVVVSEQTTKETLDQGVTEACNDLCVPVKLYYGHVAQLRDRVDKIFVPRLVSVNRRDTFCPKFLGLPDMIRNGMEALPAIMDPRIDLGKHPLGKLKLIKEIASTFGTSIFRANNAVEKAFHVQHKFETILHEGLTPPEALTALAENKRKTSINPASSIRKIAVLGYPYSLYDNYFNANLLQKLTSLGAQISTPEMIPQQVLIKKACVLPKDLFWHFSNIVIWAGMYYFEQPDCDGVIHVSNFACGPDAMVNKLLELEAKRLSKPFLTLTLDEHTGQAGIHTRIEAFIDMIERRKRQ